MFMTALLQDPVISVATEHFKKIFGAAPTVRAVAPGRVNVIGEHVDYNGGWVLPAALERRMALVIKPRDDGQVVITDAREAGTLTFAVNDLAKPEKHCWSNYIKGVVAGLVDRGIEVPGFDACLYSDVPVGGGLSSSAALEAVTAMALQKLLGFEMDRMTMAKLCQKAEHDYAGVPCGLMDQAAVLCCREGHLLLLDCHTEAIVHAPFVDPHWSLMIINSGVKHSLADGEYGKRRAACESAAKAFGVDSLRAMTEADLPKVAASTAINDEQRACVRHVLTENARTQGAVEALKAGDYAKLGKLMNASHRSLSVDYRVSCEELDFIAATGQALEGVAGCRMTGGGFGGSAIALVQAECVEAVQAAIEHAYAARFGKDPKIFVTRPGAGAMAVD